MTNKIEIKSKENILTIEHNKKTKATKFTMTGNKETTGASVEINESDLRQLAQYFEWCVAEIEKREQEKEFATVKFFDDREKEEKPKAKGKAKK